MQSPWSVVTAQRCVEFTQYTGYFPGVMISSANPVTTICTLKIVLKGSKPSVWRRIAISAESTLAELHEAIQCVMPWENYHLHEFIVGNKHYGEPHPDYGDNMFDEVDLKLKDVFAKRTRDITYIYDFGDGWQHSVECEAIGPADMDMENYPVCLDGANACPPEDSGSLFGYYRKLKILRNPKHKEYQEIRDWMPPEFDPAAFDVEEANVLLEIGIFNEDDFDDLPDPSIE